MVVKAFSIVGGYTASMWSGAGSVRRKRELHELYTRQVVSYTRGKRELYTRKV